MFEECRIEGVFSLSSGRKTGIFYDFNLLLPKEIMHYTEMLIQSIPMDLRKKIAFVAAPAHGGDIPGWIAACALGNKPLVRVDHNGNVLGPAFVEGNYLLVDDVCTSFSEANRARTALGKNKCVGVACFIFRGNGLDLGKQDVPVFYLERKEEEQP